MNAKNIAKGGLFTAAGFIFLYLSSFMPTNKLAFLILSSVVIPITLLTCDLKTSILVYGATSLLSLLIPNKIICIVYIFLFGIYGIVKYYAEKLDNRVIEFIVKYAFFNISLGICYFIYSSLFMELTNSKLPIYILIAGAEVIFGVYDFILTGFISYFMNKFSKFTKSNR